MTDTIIAFCIIASWLAAVRLAYGIGKSSGIREETQAFLPYYTNAYKQGIADFVNRMSADYRHHTARGVREDMMMAVAYFGVDPDHFFNDTHDQGRLRAQAEVYRVDPRDSVTVDLATADPGLVCGTPDCPGDARYSAPGRGHIKGCLWPGDF